MITSFFRSLVIFRLAVALLIDYWRIRRANEKLDGARRDQVVAQAYARTGARIRRAAFHLQGLIIKVGQFLSARTDVLPLSFTRELTQLQDAVPGVSLHKVKPMIEQELGAHLSTMFLEVSEEPLAAASLGQVHKGVLPSGDIVAIKVLRPGIEKLAAVDLFALKKVVLFMANYTRIGRQINIKGLYEEFSAMVQKELDYRIEADNLRHFQKNFINDKRIVIPRLYDNYVTRRILVMEYIEGAKVTDLSQIDAWNITPEIIAKILLDTYLQQILVDGFVHVDPHPGNLLILPNERVCFLDFGMMSSIELKDISIFSRLVTAALTRNLAGVVQGMDELGFLQPHANREFLQRAIGFMLDRISGISLKKGEKFDQFLEEFQRFLHDEPISIQARYMFLGRAIGMASGVITSLYPDIDWLKLLKDRALPLLSAHVEQENSWRTTWKKPLHELAVTLFGDAGALATDLVLTQLEQTILATVQTPDALLQVLRRADRGDLSIKLELEPVLTRLERQERIILRGMYAILMSVCVTLGVWLEQTRFVFQSKLAFSVALLFGVILVVHIFKHRKARPKRRA